MLLRSTQQLAPTLTKLKALSFTLSGSKSFIFLARFIGRVGGHFDRRRPLMVDLWHHERPVKSLNIYGRKNSDTFNILACARSSQENPCIKDMPMYDISK